MDSFRLSLSTLCGSSTFLVVSRSFRSTEQLPKGRVAAALSQHLKHRRNPFQRPSKPTHGLPFGRHSKLLLPPKPAQFRVPPIIEDPDPDAMSSGTQRLVILGSGWGGYSLLKNLIKRKVYRITVVTPRNHFLFTPLLASTTVGTLEFRSVIEPIRNAGFQFPEDFHLAEAIGWDMKNKTVQCKSILQHDNVYSIPYDKLVIAVGSLPNTFNTPGVKEYAHFLKEVPDARSIRNQILSNFELSMEPGVSEEESIRLLHTVIVGGGPTGVEFGGELYDFVQQDVSRLYRRSQSYVRVTIVEPKQLLSSFDQNLQEYAERKMKSRPNFELIHSAVTEVKPNGVVLKDGRFLPCGLVVWSTGVAPRPFVQNLDVYKNKVGQILTDNRMHILSDESHSSFALGDCAQIEGHMLPATAQVAEREGRYLANVLRQMVYGDLNPKPFVFNSMGMLTYIGGYKALADLPQTKLKGYVSWFIWRSAYLTRLGSWRLRVQVPLDWLKTLLFGRDTSRF